MNTNLFYSSNLYFAKWSDVGTTRDNFDGKEVLRLEYEAYLPMARRKMLEVCANMRSRWAVENISMIHRIG